MAPGDISELEMNITDIVTFTLLIIFPEIVNFRKIYNPGQKSMFGCYTEIYNSTQSVRISRHTPRCTKLTLDFFLTGHRSWGLDPKKICRRDSLRFDALSALFTLLIPFFVHKLLCSRHFNYENPNKLNVATAQLEFSFLYPFT